MLLYECKKDVGGIPTNIYQFTILLNHINEN